MSRPKHILYCNTCGFVDVRNRYRKCPFCNKKLIESEHPFVDKPIWYSYELEAIEEEIFQQTAKCNPEFDQTAYEKRIEEIRQQEIQKEECKRIEHNEWLKQKAKSEQAAARRAAEQANAPRCPTCGSTDLKKIDAFDRAISVSFLGLASSKIGKTFKCNHCGYMW